MCGLAGFFLRQDLVDPEGVLESMGEALIHRGPDSKGQYFDVSTGLGLVHRRLSIIDPSPKGSQPMVSASGRYRMIYNGEVVNFRSLGSETLVSSSNGEGDSAKILECFESIGVEASLKKFRGMFALAVFDRLEKKLTLARDPIGIKPLYYAWTRGGSFLFGSELTSLEAHPHFDPKVDQGSLNLLLRFGNIPQPSTIYTGVYKIPPGHVLEVQLEGSPEKPRPQPYRTALDCARKGWESPFEGTREEALGTLKEGLRESLKEHLIADVPLGAFLSGGVDSSLICYLAQEIQSKPLKTFTIGFDEKDFDEAHHARRIAEHLKTDHQELILNPTEIGKRVPNLISRLDEPFADSSFIPTFMVSEMTKSEVSVSLSGDGGDELFGGYERYRWTPEIWSRISRLPQSLRSGMGTLGMGLSQKTWKTFLGPFRSMLPEELRVGDLGSRVHRLSRLMGSTSPRDVYLKLMTLFDRQTELLKVRGGPQALLDSDGIWELRDDLGEKMMLMDLLGYLTDDILTKVDRASMAVGLEARVPFLTPELVELAWSFPSNWRRKKELLSDILTEGVPNQMVDRPKMGFAVPLASWLRGTLRSWGEDLLSSKVAKEGEWFKVDQLQKLWKEHLSGRSDRSQELWVILCFLQWKDQR